MFKYQQIIFDADNTLFDFDQAEAAALVATLAHFKMPRPPGLIDFYRQMNVGLWQQLEARTINIEQLKQRRAEQLFDFVGQQADIKTFSLHYLDELAKQQILLPGVADTLAHLTPHCEMAIITNGLARVQKPRFANSSIQDHFGALVISEELGVAKPNPEIFAHTCDLMGWEDPAKVLMVGDNYTCDVQGAVDFGMRSCWFNLRQIKHNHSDHHYEIKQFDQLLTHI
ncbi:YjjG family noncanonical pyrimidine nucleotidase [Marinicella sp. S1101]|uniref:YjjG family noncanonical pyrimidine nucleotidase n=1 Tax=Marinicella marina TaxID=2996016 RepID=UPI002260EFBD|nr:YjjG family noncanonical pyrimidine nucleotidase [Marinicella marina]MCX7552339.1 YjjG family noncanonical pyrimidine nucleotidase [Marinicella marina]MDJ1139214.1 YjjG family noncanonical pyrimidine nucleotidase [Marinicella marina]